MKKIKIRHAYVNSLKSQQVAKSFDLDQPHMPVTWNQARTMYEAAKEAEVEVHITPEPLPENKGLEMDDKIYLVFKVGTTKPVKKTSTVEQTPVKMDKTKIHLIKVSKSEKHKMGGFTPAFVSKVRNLVGETIYAWSGKGTKVNAFEECMARYRVEIMPMGYDETVKRWTYKVVSA